MQEIHETDFEELVEKSASPVLVDFGATWCPPCKMLHPIVERIADEYAKQLAVYEVNTDKDPALARRFSITGVPTLIFFKEGQPVKNVVGFREYDALKAIVDSIL
ncbi:MAG: thioredoxin [Candidatus Riflebacteria bacterium RBG_13_59_9]|nr:MAG: thioredoxin [Candidatus Riflebacteria bacterium RBG_13_59_9]